MNGRILILVYGLFMASWGMMLLVLAVAWQNHARTSAFLRETLRR